MSSFSGSAHDVPSEGVPRYCVLHCPWCHAQHFDEGEWLERPHHKHLCAKCGKLWRIEPFCFGVRKPDEHYVGATEGTCSNCGFKWPPGMRCAECVPGEHGFSRLRPDDEAIGKMRHALGVHRRAGRWTREYRNYYHATADSPDHEIWRQLEATKFAEYIGTDVELTGGARVYSVTQKGREAALEGLPRSAYRRAPKNQGAK